MFIPIDEVKQINPSLTSLQLQNNEFGAAGMPSICEALCGARTQLVQPAQSHSLERCMSIHSWCGSGSGAIELA
jgi:hypothetical protein